MSEAEARRRARAALAVGSLLAAWGPARRAAAVAPVEALRPE